MDRVTNFGRFYSLFNRLPYNQCPEDTKCAFVSQASNGRTTSLRELKRWEYDRLCEQLEDLLLPHHERQRLRSRCLKLMQQYGVDTTDWDRINAFCKDSRIAGKPFRYIGIEELRKLAIKLRMMIRKNAVGKPPSTVLKSRHQMTVQVTKRHRTEVRCTGRR